MTSAFALALLLAAPTLSFAERVEGTRAVERARYAFAIGATMPFDELYPRSVFEKKVRREPKRIGLFCLVFVGGGSR